MTEVQNDPDRVLHPLRRRPDGTSRRSTWDEALDDIGARAAGVRTSTAAAVGWYMGNPGAFSYSHALWVKGFLDASARRTTTRPARRTSTTASPPRACSTARRSCAGPRPLPHASSSSCRRRQPAGLPRLRAHRAAHPRAAAGDRRRGGRVVVVDPRRSETARAFEHVRVRPDRDAWLLLSLLHVIFAEGLDDGPRVAGRRRGRGALERWPPPTRPRRPRRRTGVAAETCARWPATSPGPAAPPCTGAPARAWGASARSSPSCSTRSTW